MLCSSAAQDDMHAERRNGGTGSRMLCAVSSSGAALASHVARRHTRGGPRQHTRLTAHRTAHRTAHLSLSLSLARAPMPVPTATAHAVPLDGDVTVFAEAVRATPVWSNPASRQHVRGTQYLAGEPYRWPAGLVNSLFKSLDKNCIRFFVIDDSGSMERSDGLRVERVPNGSCVKVPCTRWRELCDAVSFHAELAYEAQAPSEFRFLNRGHPIEIGYADDDRASLREFQELLRDGPSRGTPLCHHVREIVRRIVSIEDDLRRTNKKVSLTIFTDGESSDGDLAQALKPLERLPCWVVIRLCTNEDRIVQYWNTIDDNLELEMDVLDDWFGEGAEITQHNPWLTYGEPLHRFREFGSHYKELDLLDEAPLNADQLRATLAIVLGGEPNTFPHPTADLPGLTKHVHRLLESTPPTVDPKSLGRAGWIVSSRLNGRHGFFSMGSSGLDSAQLLLAAAAVFVGVVMVMGMLAG